MRIGPIRARAAVPAVVVVLGAVLAGVARPTSLGPPTPVGIRHAIDGVVKPYMTAHPGDLIGICVGAIDGTAKAIKCYGAIAANQTKHPNRTTLFGIGSISKTFAATLLALRVQQGSVHLDDPVATYVPGTPTSMTLLDLADHYSGLPRKPKPQPVPQSAAQLFADAVHCEQLPSCPHDVPGHSFLYSNYAFSVLGELVAKHDGATPAAGSSEWDVDNAQNVTGPLGMKTTQSWFRWKADDPGYFDTHRAIGQVGSPPQEPNPPTVSSPWVTPAGGLFSSSLDMTNWLEYSMGGFPAPAALAAAQHLLYQDPAHIRTRGQNPRQRIGLAWNIDVNPGGIVCIQKGGAVPGFRAYMIFVKGMQRGAFVMLNNSPQHTNVVALGTQILNALPASASPAPICAAPPVEE